MFCSAQIYLIYCRYRARCHLGMHGIIILLVYEIILRRLYVIIPADFSRPSVVYFSFSFNIF